MVTHDQMRRLVIRHLLDRFGRYRGRIQPFYIYSKLPNYESIPLKEEAELQPFMRMQKKLHQTGSQYSEEALMVGDILYISCCSMLDKILKSQGFRFSMDDIEAMFIEAQTLSIERYSKLQKKQERLRGNGGNPRLTFPELYDMYGERLVYFVHGYNGIGKSTWIELQRAVLAKQKEVVLDGDSQWFVTRPLAELQVIDSGRFLPASGQISRGQVVQTIPLSVEEYTKALRTNHPLAIVDTGDNLGQRVAMLMQARDIRGKDCPIHVEMLDASLLQALVQNQDRERKEYCLEPEKVHEAYEVMSQLATSCHKRDFRSPKYRQLYTLLYTEKWCAWEKGPCRFKSHEPNDECGLCNHCSRHCAHKTRFGNRQSMRLCEKFPLLPNDGVFL